MARSLARNDTNFRRAVKRLLPGVSSDYRRRQAVRAVNLTLCVFEKGVDRTVEAPGAGGAERVAREA